MGAKIGAVRAVWKEVPCTESSAAFELPNRRLQPNVGALNASTPQSNLV